MITWGLSFELEDPTCDKDDKTIVRRGNTGNKRVFWRAKHAARMLRAARRRTDGSEAPGSPWLQSMSHCAANLWDRGGGACEKCGRGGAETCENAVCTHSTQTDMLCSDRGAVRGVLGATLTGPSPLAFKRTANLLDLTVSI